jgi:MFS family permease
MAWFCCVVTPCQFYILSIGWQLDRRGDVGGTYMRAFIIIYSLGSPVSPLMGRLADRAGLAATMALATTLVALAVGLLALPPDSAPLGLQVAGMAAYSVGRLGVYGMFFSHVGRRFGYDHYGGLVGLGLLVSAVVSLLQYPLFTATLAGEGAAVHLGLVVLMGLTAPYLWWLHQKEAEEWRREEARASEKGRALGAL